MEFMDRFCDRCEKDARYRETTDGEDGCPIAAASMLYEVGDPEYPKEWIVDDDGLSNPRCTAFEEELSPERREDRRLHEDAEAAGQVPLFAAALAEEKP
jgi:hypothetical protein